MLSHALEFLFFPIFSVFVLHHFEPSLDFASDVMWSSQMTSLLSSIISLNSLDMFIIATLKFLYESLNDIFYCLSFVCVVYWSHFLNSLIIS